ncbi:MAG TPA: PHP-associated domain-containing protein [Vicinamibacterales bacterium]|nr:PHP-associated domain-containing protein [Vicinamibacterales bacterium]
MQTVRTDALKVDLHLHTADDPVDYILHDATTLVDRAVAQGFDALAITLHDRQFQDAALTDYARERGLVLLPGIERTIGRAHVLLINFPAAAEDVRTFSDIACLKRRCNGLVIAPHPFYPDASCLGSDLDAHAGLFDAVEWSYFWTRGVNFNARARRWARRHGKPVVGNSDLHDITQLGRTYSWVFAERERDAICGAIREGCVSLHTEPVPPRELARVFGGMLWRGRKRRARRAALQPLSDQFHLAGE